MSEGLDFRIGLDTDDGVEGAAKLDKQIEGLEKHLRQLQGPGKIEELEKKIGKLSASPFEKMIHQGLDPFLHKMKEVAEFEFIREGTEALLELPGELAHEVFELGEEMLRTAAKAERTESSFKLLFGNIGGQEALEDIEKIGDHTEFTMARIKGLTQDLGKVGFEGQGLKRARAAALDIAAFSSNPDEGLSGAQGSIERIKRTGRVDARTLGGVGIGEKDYFAELTARTGKSRKELKKEMDAGKIDADEALEALYSVITKKTGKKLGGAGADIAMGLEATLTHLGELPERYFEKLSHSSGYAKFGETMKHILDDLDPESDNGKRIFGNLERVFDGMGEIVGSIDWAGLVSTATDAIETVEIMFLEALSLIPGETGTKAGFALNNLKKRRDAHEIDESEQPKFKSAADEHGTTPAFEKAAANQEDANDLDEASAGGLLGDKSKFYSAGGDAAHNFHEGAKDGLEVHSPSRKFMKLGAFSAEGFAEGLEGGASRVDRAMDLAIMSPARGAASGGAGAPGGAAGGMVIAPHITVHVDGRGKDDQALGDAIAVRAAEVAVTALQGAIDNMAVQSGAA